MITFENGYKCTSRASSAATQDMAVRADMYKPDAAIVHQDAAHEPRDSAMIVKFMTNNNPNPQDRLPAPPPPAAVRAACSDPSDLKTEIERLGIQVNFIEPNPLQPYV